ncbi:MAG: sulfatase-like hydrolase/transferase, partial [bacterium]|nr:sulfatase-like hydrolase/transferase [bacterium]
GKSLRGIYGDVIEEIDWSVGRIIAALEHNGLIDNTLVFFSSDNGPWLIFGDQGGSAGLLRDGKGTAWDGGMRIPAIFWGRGLVKPGPVRDIGSTLDILPTFVTLAGVKAPDDRPLDGYDLAGVLRERQPSPRREMYFYRRGRLFAARVGDHKLHFITQRGYNQHEPEVHENPLLFNLLHDPGEQYNIAADHPDIVRRIRTEAERFDAQLVRGEDQNAKKAKTAIGIFNHPPIP